jgi:chromosome segregation ATPase
MPIDTSALRKFQDVWGPVLEAIPAVLEATAKKADVERELRIKQVELDEADKKIAKAFEEADKRLSSVNSEMEQAMQQKAKALADVEAAKKAQAADLAKANEAQRKAADDWNAKIAVLQSQFSNVEAEHAKKVSAAEAEFAAKVAALEADVKELEKRKATAEKALDALRSKLG